MALGDQPFGEIRIGLSTLLVRRDLNQSLAPAALAAGIALLIAVVHRRCCSRSSCCGRCT